MLIAFAGRARTGKDTATKYLVDKYGFNRIALADPVKEAYYRLDSHVIIPVTSAEALGLDLNRDGYIVTLTPEVEGSQTQLFITSVQMVVNRIGWEKAKTIPGIRKGLQKIGTECGRDIHGDTCWLKIAKEAFTGKDAISDARFSNEAVFVRENGGLVVNLVRNVEEQINPHASENDLCSEYYDVLIDNNGTIEELYEKLDNLIV